MIRQAIADKIKDVDQSAVDVGMFLVLISTPFLLGGLGYLIYAIVCMITTGKKP